MQVAELEEGVLTFTSSLFPIYYIISEDKNPGKCSLADMK